MKAGELPEGWAGATPDDLAAQVSNALSIGPFGSNLKVSDYVSSGMPLVFVRDIRAERFGGTGTRFITEAKARELQAHVVRPGDLLVTKMGDPPGDTAIYPADRVPAVITADCIKLSPDARITSSAFLRLALRAEPVREQLREQTMGVAQQKLSLARFRTTLIPLPPVDEQERIAAKVEELQALVNAASERLARASKALKRFRQAVLAAGCLGRLTAEWRTRSSFESVENLLKRIKVRRSSTGRKATDDVIPGQYALSVGDPGRPCPETWRWVPLCEVARLESGHTPSRKHPEYWQGSTCWIGLQDAREKHGGVISATRQHVAEVGLENSAARLLPIGTVCLSRTASVGYVVIMGRPMATSQDFVNWVCSEALVPRFLMYSLMAEGEGIRQFGRGTTHTTIYFPEVKAIHISLPPVQEQHEIVRRVDALFKAVDLLEEHVAVATARVNRLTQAILAKAFRGELVPTEAELARREGREYEPAEALLARIRSVSRTTATAGAAPASSTRPRNRRDSLGSRQGR